MHDADEVAGAPWRPLVATVARAPVIAAEMRRSRSGKRRAAGFQNPFNKLGDAFAEGLARVFSPPQPESAPGAPLGAGAVGPSASIGPATPPPPFRAEQSA